MQIIPAIDIIEGKCVRLEQGDFTKISVYRNEPLEVAKQFEGVGLERLHLVDLDGARLGKVSNWKVLEKIAAKTRLIVDFGGGIKTTNDIDIVFNSGAAMAAIGSIAVKEEELFSSWLLYYGVSRFLLGADVKDEKIAIHGWQEKTELDIYDFIQKWMDKNVRQVFCTDISKDGLLQGPAIELYKKIIDRFPSIEFIASGGVQSVQDIYELAAIGCKGVIVGKAIYEGRIRIEDLPSNFELENRDPKS